MKKYAAAVFVLLFGVVTVMQWAGDAQAAPEKRRSLKEQREYCRVAWHAYLESQRCFAPYITPRGVKGEAFQHCKDVPNPSGECPIGSDLGP